MSQQFETHPDCPDCFGTGVKHIQLIAARIPDPDGGDCENCNGKGVIDLLGEAQEVIRRNNLRIGNKPAMIAAVPISLFFYVTLLQMFTNRVGFVVSFVVLTVCYAISFWLVRKQYRREESFKPRKLIIAEQIVVELERGSLAETGSEAVIT